MSQADQDALCQSVMENGADKKTLDRFLDMGADCVAAMRRDPTVSSVSLLVSTNGRKCVCRRGFRGGAPGAPPPPFRAIMIREGGGTFSSRSFSTDCYLIMSKAPSKGIYRALCPVFEIRGGGGQGGLNPP